MPPSTTPNTDFKKLVNNFNEKLAELEALSKELSEFSIEHELPFWEEATTKEVLEVIKTNVEDTWTGSTNWQSSNCGWESSHC